MVAAEGATPLVFIAMMLHSRVGKDGKETSITNKFSTIPRVLDSERTLRDFQALTWPAFGTVPTKQRCVYPDVAPCFTPRIERVLCFAFIVKAFIQNSSRKSSAHTKPPQKKGHLSRLAAAIASQALRRDDTNSCATDFTFLL